MSPLLRSVAAIVAGFVVIGVLSFGTDAVLIAAGVFPPPGQPVTSVGLLLLTTAYVAVYAIFGCWLAAFLAPGHPLRHALILGALGFAFNLMGALANRGVVPDWYLLVNLALVMPYAWIGGRLREQQLARARVAAS